MTANEVELAARVANLEATLRRVQALLATIALALAGAFGFSRSSGPIEAHEIVIRDGDKIRARFGMLDVERSAVLGGETDPPRTTSARKAGRSPGFVLYRDDTASDAALTVALDAEGLPQIAMRAAGTRADLAIDSRASSYLNLTRLEGGESQGFLAALQTPRGPYLLLTDSGGKGVYEARPSRRRQDGP